MTRPRFRRILGASGLECLYFDTNVSAKPVVKAAKLASRLPVVGEYFANSIYGIWRRPS